MANAADRPAGWREEWRDPKPRGRSRESRVARARVEVVAPSPDPAELHDRAVAVLLEIAEDRDCDPSPRVGAARTLAELATRGRVGGTDVARLSDEEIDARLAQIRERLALASLPAVVTGEKATEESGDR